MIRKTQRLEMSLEELENFFPLNPNHRNTIEYEPIKPLYSKDVMGWYCQQGKHFDPPYWQFISTQRMAYVEFNLKLIYCGYPDKDQRNRFVYFWKMPDQDLFRGFIFSNVDYSSNDLIDEINSNTLHLKLPDINTYIETLLL